MLLSPSCLQEESVQEHRLFRGGRGRVVAADRARNAKIPEETAAVTPSRPGVPAPAAPVAVSEAAPTGGTEGERKGAGLR